jgi:hypothetical protein
MLMGDLLLESVDQIWRAAWWASVSAWGSLLGENASPAIQVVVSNPRARKPS